MKPTVRKGYLDTPVGQLHYAECGAGAPLLLLHQTPRSVDEYAELLPLLGASVRAVALDTLGFGASARLTEHSVERYAAGVLAAMDALDLTQADVLGHHTGGVVAVEVAATAPERVRRLVLSSTPYCDEGFRERRRHAPAIDHVEVQDDGRHLTELWQRRQGFYPYGRPDLLTRFVRDALVLGDDVEKGHGAVGAYRMEDRLGRLTCPVLVVGASADPYAFPHYDELADRIPGSRREVVAGGTVPVMETRASEMASLALSFLS